LLAFGSRFASLSAGRRLQGSHSAGPVLDDAFEGTRPPLVEIQPARHRFDSHLEVLHIDAQARRFQHQVVDDLVIQRFERRLLGVQLRLDVERLNQRVWVEEQLEDGIQQLAHERQESPVRLVKGRVLEFEVGRKRRLPFAPELFQQIRSHATRIEELFQLHVGKLADLFLGVVHATLLADSRTNLPHDLLDVDVVGANREISHGKTLQLLMFDC
jgi:hypothetical protein